MYLCVQEQDGNVLVHKNIKAQATPFLDAVEPFIPSYSPLPAVCWKKGGLSMVV